MKYEENKIRTPRPANTMIADSDKEQRLHSADFRLSVKKRSDHLMNYFLIGFFLTGLALAFFYDTWSIALGVGGLSLTTYYSVKIAMPGSELYQYVLSAVLAIFMAQYIYQMHGLFEMHFFAFIGSAILITYQNWKLQVPMLVLVLVHHASLGYLQNIGFDKVYFTQLDYFAPQAFVIHILLSAVIFFTCGLWAYQLKKYSEIHIMQIIEMGKLEQEVLLAAEANKKEQEQQAAALDKAVAQGKFEMASDVLHDIGNAVVGFGSYLTRVRRLQEQENPENLQSLARFFKDQEPDLSAAIGGAKAGAVVTMLGGIAETLRSNQEEMRKSITEQLNIIAQIQEILNIQRQYIGSQETQERKQVNLRNIINDCLSILFVSLEKSAVSVSINVPDQLPEIKGDRTRLMQVILSLLKNSLESMDGDARERVISFMAHQQGDHLLLQVSDTGNGFNQTTGHRLFEKGFSTKAAGTGLGLYNCRAIVESHSGSIKVSSEGQGKGTLATVRFKI